MPFSSRLLIVLLATAVAVDVATAAGPSDHNRYKWRDANGNLHYGDSPPSEAVRLGYEIVSPQGIVIKRVERAKTPAELAAAKAEKAKAQAERERIDASARADSQLLAGYPEEVDLARAQRQKLELLEQQVAAAQASLRSQEQVLAELLGRAAEAERSDQPLPEAQATQLANMRKQVDGQRLTVMRRENERDNAHVVFERETERYRELKARIAQSREPQ